MGLRRIGPSHRVGPRTGVGHVDVIGSPTAAPAVDETAPTGEDLEVREGSQEGGSRGERELLRYAGRRLVAAVLQLALVVFAVFVLLRVLPANPAQQFAGQTASPAQLGKIRTQFGLDQPIGAQLWTFVKGLAHGTLGHSWQSGASVWRGLARTIPVTLQFIIPAFVVALVATIALGLYSVSRRDGWIGRSLRVYSLFAGSQPEFWWGLMLIFVGWYILHWFPAPLGILGLATTAPPVHTNSVIIDSLLAGNFEACWDACRHLMLPVVTVAATLTGPFLKLFRETAEAVNDSEYLIHARAIGLPARSLRRYLLRNSVGPLLNLSGVFFAGLIGSSVIIESVFSLDGVGTYTLKGTQALDFPVIQGAVLVLTAVSLVVYVAMDVLYAVLDPRVRYQRVR